MRALLLLVVVLHLYIGLRLLPPFGPVVQAAGAVALGASLWLLPKGWYVPEGRHPWSVLVPWIVLGFFSWLLVLTLARDVTLVASALAATPVVHARWVRASAIAVMALTPAITLAGFLMARRVAPVVTVEVPIAGLPRAFHGFTIAQVSDLHVGPTIKGDFVAGVVERVNGLEPDAVALTGDLVDGSVAELRPHMASLARLRARDGVFAILGNHEYYSGAQSWTRELERLGARVLVNEHAVIDRSGERLVIAGVTDYSAHHFDPAHRSDPAAAMAGAPPGAIRILLAHQPRTAPAARDAGFHLQLSGHTHGGQFWPWNHFVRFQQPWTAGLQRLDGLWIYVSRGTGYWGPPMRFGIPSEITRLRLVAAPGDATRRP